MGIQINNSEFDAAISDWKNKAIKSAIHDWSEKEKVKLAVYAVESVLQFYKGCSDLPEKCIGSVKAWLKDSSEENIIRVYAYAAATTTVAANIFDDTIYAVTASADAGYAAYAAHYAGDTFFGAASGSFTIKNTINAVLGAIEAGGIEVEQKLIDYINKVNE